MKVRILPSKPRGEVTAPPSKSMAHRALICAALSKGESVVRHIALSEDISATVDCLRALGADIRISGDTAVVLGADIKGEKTAELLCRESGSTLRFMIPLCLLSEGEKTLSGSERLFSRPLSVYEEICQKQGIRYERGETSLRVEGRLQTGVFEIPGDISSQLISGLLFALPLLDGDSEIRLIPPVESKPYIDMTVQTLSDFGIGIEETSNGYFVRGSQKYSNNELFVEGDWSNAAFFEAMDTIFGDIRVTGLREDSLQGDKCCKILLEKIKRGESPIDIRDCPDLAPILFTAAAVFHGAVFEGTKRLSIKESDRAQVMREELSKFGAKMIIEEDRVTVEDTVLYAPTEPLCGHNDHRVVMSLSVLAALYDAEIEGCEAVRKSFPDFFSKLKELNVEVEEYGMDQ